MKISSWLTTFRRGIAGQLDMLGRKLDTNRAMLQTLTEGQAKNMATLADIKTAEEAQGEKLNALVALTDAIFAKVSNAPADDPTAQDILDMISTHNATMDETMTRDALQADPAPSDTPADTPADTTAPAEVGFTPTG